MRTLLAAGCFIAMLIGGIWPILAPFRRTESFPTTAGQSRVDHAELQCFAEGVLRHTDPRAAIRFVLPDDESDGGLVNHRLRYIVPGRQIMTTGEARYVASWRQPAATGTVIWSGCGGVLVRR